MNDRTSEPRASRPARWPRLAPRVTDTVVMLSDAWRLVLASLLCALGPAAAYAVMGAMARRLYQFAEPLRRQSENNVRTALGDRFGADAIRRMAEQAFIHRAWNLADLMLARRFIRRSTHRRYGGRISDPHLGLLLDAQRRHEPVILLTAYYGSFDLLPLFLGYNGIKAAAIYRPHANLRYDSFRNAVRGGSGCRLIPVSHALTRLPELLESGGTVAILADHEASGRGVPVTFLGRPTVVPRTIGLLAEHYNAIVATAGIRRKDGRFCFELVVSDLFGSDAWRGQEDVIAYITRRYVAAMERIVLDDPTQYLWVHDRWGNGTHRPTDR